MGRHPKSFGSLDRELEDLPLAARWRVYMGRVEAVLFTSSEPVSRDRLASLIGETIVLDDLIADIRAELKNRPYDISAIAGGWQFRTRPHYADAIAACGMVTKKSTSLTKTEVLVLTAIAYLQPVTRAGVSELLGREISRDVIAALRDDRLIASGPRSPEPGAPYTYVTTAQFLARFGFDSLQDLPEIERLQETGILEQTGFGPNVEDGAGEREGNLDDLADDGDLADDDVDYILQSLEEDVEFEDEDIEPF